ncbi:hypothetical protein ABW19_dt0202281 [Dactylella cylindrospora]|nr:hypothetical protein ABW19_dt0202281 [Dactylella cylindrospora]
MIYLLPFSVVRVLPLPKSQKIGVGITFALGFLCIFFAAAVIVIGYVSSSATTNWIVAVFEQTWCICVACAPALKGLTTGLDLNSWRKHLRLRREKRRDDESEVGTATGTPHERPNSDATVIVPEDLPYEDPHDHQTHYRSSSRIDSILTGDEKPHSPKSPSHVNITPIVPPTNRQSYDTEYQRSNPSSPGCTMSIASIIDFHDLERQLQMDDERRQAKNCSPVLERRSSEQQFNIDSSTALDPERPPVPSQAPDR